MHEVSLGQTLRDYLTGEDVEQTTYEDLRQALAQILVEDRGYPRETLTPKVEVRFPIASGEYYCRTVDLVAAGADGTPLLLVLFCPGQVNTYRRESLAAARLIAGGPAPFVCITDTRDAILVATQTDSLLNEGMQAIPRWKELPALIAEHPASPISEEQADKERRILHTYSEFIKTCCGESICML